ncbi:flavodoxin [Paenibacillus sp. N1-5-1-14]|uniref:flavodoxin n=1 Tax=Paenibacillus radicibacter TaxID=2972488 RepID=UPI002159662D|nr:flavodoxin [Paenibacillus radicibacter]MCR8643238.1 flavodoxin [Paenibacillus radicibacter]
MENVVMIFASLSGNTEAMADEVAAGIREAGAALTVGEAYTASAGDLVNYDGIVLGAYTWGDGELPDDFLDFYEDLDDVDLTGKKAAVFGSGDMSYEIYCAAVDILIEKLRERGCEIVLEGLKVENGPTTAQKEQCKQFGSRFVTSN